MDLSNDVSCHLSDIQSRLSAPIRSTLLEIQKHQISKSKPIEWISDLECLSISQKAGQKRRYGDYREFVEVEPSKMILKRLKINPLENRNQRDYIAVSWVWNHETGEKCDIGKYLIESRQGGHKDPSDVRDVVLERVINYATCSDCRLFWIDKICINQKDKEELEDATQAMDLVYSLSRKPLGIINRHIRTREELKILTTLMMGGYVNRNGDLSEPHKASEVLELIRWLTATSWFCRAWTFQEDYKASVNMVLLISHDSALERLKLKQIFKSVPGELCVNSAEFRTQLTWFCQAYRRQFRSNQEDMRKCNEILNRAGKYTILLREKDEDGHDIIRKPMSPTILADIGAREIEKPWDRLAIVANCCGYDVRLNAKELSNHNFSCSLSMLTQHLLNGEIIRNDQSNDKLLTQNVYDFLKSQCLDNFNSPINEELTFIKGCRFTEVKLVNEGVQTSGHLWKIGRKIEVECGIKLAGEVSTPDGLDGIQRYRLKQLAHELGTGVYGKRYETLADDILQYLHEERSSTDSFAKLYKSWMANEVFHAMTNPGKVLWLGCLVDRANTQTKPYRGIFVCDANDQDPEYIFTSWRQSRENSQDIDKHVSLEVSLLNPNTKGLPRLITKKWVNGLCFASRGERSDVLFPWPRFLKT